MSILKEICNKKLDEVSFLKQRVNFNKNEKIYCRDFLGYLKKENKENFNPEKLISALDKIIGSTKKRNPVSQGGYEFVVKLLGR